MSKWPKAPELTTSHWLNTNVPLTIEGLKGKVVALHTFQMLCPGCVSYGLPQASKLAHFFRDEDLVVIGLHTVFEHHQAMQLESLKAFVHEYRLNFPIAVDASSDGDIPITMAEYGLAGTPALVLIDRQGQVRFAHHGAIDDMLVSKMVSFLLCEDKRNNEDLDLFSKVSGIGQSSGEKCSANP